MYLYKHNFLNNSFNTLTIYIFLETKYTRSRLFAVL